MELKLLPDCKAMCKSLDSSIIFSYQKLCILLKHTFDIYSIHLPFPKPH